VRGTFLALLLSFAAPQGIASGSSSKHTSYAGHKKTTPRDSGIPTEFFIVPSKVLAKKAGAKPYGKDKQIWYWLDLTDAKPYQDRWDIFRGS
jgi:hypothetical protein